MTLETMKRHISAGVYDTNLAEIENLINARLSAIRNARTTADFGLGDRVLINDQCGIPHLRGQRAAVVGRNSVRVTVKLENPVGGHAKHVNGEWVGGEVRVLPNVIDPMV